jgi:hypothetical protein
MSQPLGKKSGCNAPYSMIRLEIIDLFLEDNGPEVLADELNNVEIVGKARPVSGEATISMVNQVLLKC